MNRTLTALPGVRVGHATRAELLTGVTAVLFDRPLPVAYACHGGAPGTLNTDTMAAARGGSRAHALFVSGGSLTGLHSAGHIAARLIDDGVGYPIHAIINPNVTGAIVMDLGVRIAQFDPALGAAAYDAATSEPVARGNVGAGTGTAVGKFRHFDAGRLSGAMKAGVGCARVDLPHGGVVTCLTVVNAVGNVVERDGSILAGNRRPEGDGFEDFLDAAEYYADPANTTVSLVGTNVTLPGPAAYERVAHLAAHGHVRAISPVNLAIDGDTVFVFSTEEVPDVLPAGVGNRLRSTTWPRLDIDIVGHAAATAVQDSIYDACRSAESIPFAEAVDELIPACSDRSAGLG